MYREFIWKVSMATLDGLFSSSTTCESRNNNEICLQIFWRIK